MELIMISDTRLKVVLTRVDMEKYHLDFDGDAYESTATRRAMMRLFDDVKRRVGFDISDDRILVQIWQSSDGGCELYISKMESKPHTRRTPRVTACDFETQIYRFATLADLIAVCHALDARRYDHPSEVLHADDGRWYLLLDGVEVTSPLDALSFIGEYAEKQGATLSPYVLREHAVTIAREDAVAQFAALACI